MSSPPQLAYFLTHPIQYQAPLLRYLAQRDVALRVYYGCDPQAEGLGDPGFQREIRWDVPLTEGYSHEILADTRTLPASIWKRFRYFSRRASEALRKDRCEAVWIHGWGNPYPRTPYYSLAAWRAARKLRLPILLRGETHHGCLRGQGIRRYLHRLLLARLFKSITAFLAVGTANEIFYRSYGVPSEKIFLVPYTVDNAFFQERCREAAARREAFRRSLDLPEDARVILYCGRLAPEKEPGLLLEAVARVQKKMGAAKAPVLVMVGDGPLRGDVELMAAQCVPGSVKLVGFRNQTELPSFYDLCDVFALPSSFEPWGLVVNEVMNAGKPIVVSDRVGAGEDLVMEGVNGARFPSGDTEALAKALLRFLEDPALRVSAGQASLGRINQWGFEQDREGLLAALDKMRRHSA